MSSRRACELIEIARSGLDYESVRAERDVPTLEAMKHLAAQYPRYGYRRIRVFLRREGHGMSRHRAHRLWRLAGLQLPQSCLFVVVEAFKQGDVLAPGQLCNDPLHNLALGPCCGESPCISGVASRRSEERRSMALAPNRRVRDGPESFGRCPSTTESSPSWR